MKKNVLIFISIIVFQSCGSDNEEQKTPEPEISISQPTSVKVKDIGNLANGHDFELSFSKPSDLSQVLEFRIYIVPESLANSFDSLTALMTPIYLRLSKSSSSSQLGFTEDYKDVLGDLIIENKPYSAFVMSIAIGDSNLGGALSKPSNTITLQQKNPVWTLTGNILGGSGGMDVDADGNIYMADFGASLSSSPGTKVFKVTPEGVISTFASGLVGASGNDFDNDGNLIQSNIGAGTVSKITPDGIVTTIASGFTSPVGVTVAPNGDFFVCNCNANSVSKVTTDGTVSTFSNSTLMSCPNGIDMDSQGNLYVANFSSSNLVKITPGGQASVFAAMPGNNNGHLLINGNFIYVVSRGLHQIHKDTFTGSVSLFAGTGTRGITNGPLLEARFSFPNDLAFSPDGKRMYVNDVNAGNDSNILSPVVIRVVELIE